MVTTTTTTPSSPRITGRARAMGLVAAITGPEIRGDLQIHAQAAVRLLLARRRSEAHVLQDDELRRRLERIDEAPHVAIIAGQRVGRRELGELAALLVLDRVGPVFELHVGLLRELREPRVGELARDGLVRGQHVLVELLQRRVRLLLAGHRGLRRLRIQPRPVQLLALDAHLRLGACHLVSERKDDDRVQQRVGDERQDQRDDEGALLRHAALRVHRFGTGTGATEAACAAASVGVYTAFIWILCSPSSVTLTALHWMLWKAPLFSRRSQNASMSSLRRPWMSRLISVSPSLNSGWTAVSMTSPGSVDSSWLNSCVQEKVRCSMSPWASLAAAATVASSFGFSPRRVCSASLTR